MFDWRFWQYRDDNNCWDFVREVLHKEFNVPAEFIPKFGICPDDKAAMTREFRNVKKRFHRITAPKDGAVACHFSDEVLIHVGIVRNQKVWHASRSRGLSVDPFNVFEKLAITRYYQWQG